MLAHVDTLTVRLAIRVSQDSLRKALITELSLTPGLQPEFLSPWATSGLAVALQGRFDVLVQEASLPPGQSARALRQLRASGVTIPILVVSPHDSAILARMALDNGAMGFVLQSELATHLRPAVDAVCRGAPYLSPKVWRLAELSIATPPA